MKAKGKDGGMKTTVTQVPNQSNCKKNKELEKQLDGLIQQIGLIKDKKDGEEEKNLLEQKILLLLKLKQYGNVVDEGYKILGKKGPSIIVYKGILVSLCKLGKFDEVIELLEQWKRASPKCSEMTSTKAKMEGYLTAIRSGVDVNKLLQSIEKVIEVGKIEEKEPSWKYRPPPQSQGQATAFTLCSCMATHGFCLFGKDCPGAHSKQELKEWQERINWKKGEIDNSSNSNVKVLEDKGKMKPIIPKDQIPLCYRTLPPACMYYLTNLSKKVQETKNLKTLFVDNLSDVKIQFVNPDSIVKRLSLNPSINAYKWSIMITSKRPLATVTLLNDQIRDRFSIYAAFYQNSKNARIDLIDLHPNNKSQVNHGIQVLNTFIRPELFLPFNGGWPDWCYYQIDVVFQTRLNKPGVFEQQVVFDFKSDPKILRRITITLEPPEVEDNKGMTSPGTTCALINNPSSSSGSITLSHSQSVSDSDDNFDQDQNQTYRPNDLNKVMNRIEGSMGSVTVSSSVQEWIKDVGMVDVDPLLEELEHEALTKDNYISWMSRFLTCERKARERELLNLSVKSDISIFDGISLGFATPSSMGLFGKLYLTKDVSQDSKIGRLILNSCHTISIGEIIEGSLAISKPKTYPCRVITKTEQAMVIFMDSMAVNEFKLSHGSIRRLDIWLHLDHTYLQLLNSFLQRVIGTHLLNVLFPTFNDNENEPWDFNDLVNTSMPKYEFDEILNGKQRIAVQAILSKSQACSDSDQGIPVLITGPTGSGKSFVIGHSISALFNLVKTPQSLPRVLICTCSNDAADEFVTIHLTDYLQTHNPNPRRLLRLFSPECSIALVNPDVQKYCLLSNDHKGFRYPSIEELGSYAIIVTTVSTCLDLLRLGVLDCLFSHLFIDNCHQLLEIETLCPLLLAGRNYNLILTGDVNTLSPETFSLPTPNSKCQEVSLIQRLVTLYPERHPLKINLDETYTTTGDIVRFISNEFYTFGLKCAKSSSSHPVFYPLTFAFVNGGEDSKRDHGDGYYNMKEIYEILDRLNTLIKQWPPNWGSPRDNAIAVITPYPDQALGLRIKLKHEGFGFINVLTLQNALSSKQYRVIFISTVRTFSTKTKSEAIKESETGGGFFTNSKAVYTVLSKAQSLVILTGDFTSLCNFGECKNIWRQYMKVCRQNNGFLGLPNTLELGTPSDSPVKSNILGPITRPASTSLISPQSLISQNPHASPVLEDARFKEPQRSHDLSSIWNYPSQSQAPKPLEQAKTTLSLSSYQPWGNSSGLGHLASIWSNTVTETQTHPPPNSVSHSNESETTSSYKNAFDMPDVKLMAEAALGEESVPSTLRFHQPQTQAQNHNLSNMPALFNLHNPLSNLGMLGPNPQRLWGKNSHPQNTISASAFFSQNSSTSMPNSQMQTYPHLYPHFVPSGYTYNNPTAPKPQLTPSYPSVALNSQTGLENFNTSLAKESPKDFDFFTQLSLKERASSSLSQTSNIIPQQDEKARFRRPMSVEEFPDLKSSQGTATGWIKVKKTKKKSTKEDGKMRNKKQNDNDEITTDKVIKSLQEMGFDRRKVIKALQACDSDMERSIEWLIQTK